MKERISFILRSSHHFKQHRILLNKTKNDIHVYKNIFLCIYQIGSIIWYVYSIFLIFIWFIRVIHSEDIHITFRICHILLTSFSSTFICPLIDFMSVVCLARGGETRINGSDSDEIGDGDYASWVLTIRHTVNSRTWQTRISSYRPFFDSLSRNAFTLQKTLYFYVHRMVIFYLYLRNTRISKYTFSRVTHIRFFLLKSKRH